MRQSLFICMPALALLGLIWSFINYQMMRKKTPIRGKSYKLALPAVIGAVSSVLIMLDGGRTIDAWNKMLFPRYSSEWQTVGRGTEDAHTFYIAKFPTPEDEHVSENLNYLFSIVCGLALILPSIWWNTIYRLEKWEFEHEDTFTKRLESKKKQKEWYSKHPSWEKPKSLT